MNSECKFWNSILDTVNPGWSISVAGSGDRIGSGLLQALRVRVYVADTSNGWLLAGATSAQDVTRLCSARDQGRFTNEQVIGAANQAAAACAKAGPPHDLKQASETISMCMLAMTRTQTYQAALHQNGSPDGHWLYLLYRMRDGSLVSRPVFMFNHQPGLIESAVLRQIVRTVVRLDLSGNSTAVANRLRIGGGALLDADLVSPDRAASNGFVDPASKSRDRP